MYFMSIAIFILNDKVCRMAQRLATHRTIRIIAICACPILMITNYFYHIFFSHHLSPLYGLYDDICAVLHTHNSCAKSQREVPTNFHQLFQYFIGINPSREINNHIHYSHENEKTSHKIANLTIFIHPTLLFC